jgi:phosphoribosylamine---glycine ligase
MQENKIPTAQFKVFTMYQSALAYVRLQKFPVVVKASGLSAGKGVYVCKTLEEAQRALSAIMVDHVHGDQGGEVVIEEFLDGPELSVHALTDGLNSILFPGSQDHKRLLDGNEGENTGGMGAIAPVPWASLDMMNAIETSVVNPALKGMLTHGASFEGLLYPGMIVTNGGFKVLEFNARFGDPETQVYMRLLKNDLLDLLEACMDKTLANMRSLIGWHRGFAVAVTLASGGYPGEYQKGFPITGLSDVEAMEDVVVFHAGTTFDGELKTAGGRVLSVSAFGVSPKDAIEKAYAAIQKIHFEGMQYRKDIGAEISRFYSSVRV